MAAKLSGMAACVAAGVGCSTYKPKPFGCCLLGRLGIGCYCLPARLNALPCPALPCPAGTPASSTLMTCTAPASPTWRSRWEGGWVGGWVHAAGDKVGLGSVTVRMACCMRAALGMPGNLLGFRALPGAFLEWQMPGAGGSRQQARPDAPLLPCAHPAGLPLPPCVGAAGAAGGVAGGQGGGGVGAVVPGERRGAHGALVEVQPQATTSTAQCVLPPALLILICNCRYLFLSGVPATPPTRSAVPRCATGRGAAIRAAGSAQFNTLPTLQI